MIIHIILIFLIFYHLNFITCFSHSHPLSLITISLFSVHIRDNTIHEFMYVAQMLKNLSADQKTQVLFLGQEDPLERGIYICCSCC